ncbi:hypothetical protein TanjilG_21698 [Lupinus angustifolius]|uniref:TF-B3 domain-containing protein n=1 Tax=Lupinus angustifolius TaxID=3871 RepID=A0A1J7G233_LUPAN|nr:PREDICTED: B3 domain-containing transcription factor LEC2-like [Lupinus angustifolius]OIV94358.1 hypothetical protein TanjilG_21698 [Lupinus angustifolius]
MDEFWTPFSIPTTNPTTTIATTSASRISHSSQIMDHPQNVVFSDHTEPPHFNPITPSPPMLYVPPPYIAPYDQNLGEPFMRMNQPSLSSYPMYSAPVEPSNLVNPRHESQGLSQSREENMMMNDALTAKVARYRRKQARQRVRSSSTIGVPSIPEGTIRGQPQATHVFYAPNGKMLTQFLTKKLRNSDVGNVGRIVIPKRGAEEMLPTLCNKEGTNILLQDVYSDLKWSFKYKYWSNNKSHRMYVLENTVDFVNHYELRVGDSITLYKDEFTNLYVSANKEQNLEEPEDSSSIKGTQTHGTDNYNYMHTAINQAIDEEEQASFTLLLNELGHNRDEDVTNDILTIYNDGGSSS